MTEWGLFPWFEESGVWHVHPDDLERLRDLVPYSRVFRFAGRKDGYLVLRSGLADFRVRPELFSPVPPPAFDFEEWVAVVPRERHKEPHIGTVRDILWHHKDNCHVYVLHVDGKNSTKRYRRDELESVKG